MNENGLLIGRFSCNHFVRWEASSHDAALNVVIGTSTYSVKYMMVSVTPITVAFEAPDVFAIHAQSTSACGTSSVTNIPDAEGQQFRIISLRWGNHWYQHCCGSISGIIGCCTDPLS
jgi:hypothetical protein